MVSEDVLRTLDFEVVGRRRRGRPKMTWRKQVVKQVKRLVSKREMPMTDQSGAILLINCRRS